MMTTANRFVIDTNLLVSRLLVPTSRPALAVSAAVESGTLLFSRATLAEVARVLMRPKFDPYVTVEHREQFLILLTRISHEVEITRLVKACRDPKDDMVLEVAINGDAEFVLTGDKDLLVLNPFLGIPIISPPIF